MLLLVVSQVNQSWNCCLFSIPSGVEEGKSPPTVRFLANGWSQNDLNMEFSLRQGMEPSHGLSSHNQWQRAGYGWRIIKYNWGLYLTCLDVSKKSTSSWRLARCTNRLHVFCHGSSCQLSDKSWTILDHPNCSKVILVDLRDQCWINAISRETVNWSMIGNLKIVALSCKS